MVFLGGVRKLPKMDSVRCCGILSCYILQETWLILLHGVGHLANKKSVPSLWTTECSYILPLTLTLDCVFIVFL